MADVHANFYDGLTMWCETPEGASDLFGDHDFVGSGGPPSIDKLGVVTCDACLAAIEAYGRRVAAIRQYRQTARTGGRCRIGSHSADCRCCERDVSDATEHPFTSHGTPYLGVCSTCGNYHDDRRDRSGTPRSSKP